MATANRIDTAFERLAADGRKGLLPYITAGYPDLETTAKLLTEFDRAGATAVEVGIPYSDPIADGPVIQTSFVHALSAGVKVGSIFEMVADLRRRVSIPLLSMVSFSVVYRIGVDRYVERCRAAGFDGLIVADLSLEEAPSVAERISRAGLRLAMLAAPTSSWQRRERIAQISTGFLYYVSVTGVTGERDRLPDDLVDNVKRLREVGGLPVCVGFGISTPQHVRTVCTVADGAIVGSAIIRRITDCMQAGHNSDQIVSTVSQFVGELQEAASGG